MSMEMDSSTDSEIYMEDDDDQLFTSRPWLIYYHARRQKQERGGGRGHGLFYSPCDLAWWHLAATRISGHFTMGGGGATPA